MRIEEISLVVADLEVAANYYEHVLGLPVNRTRERVHVAVGTTTVELTGNPTHPGTHHLAITVPSNKFDAAKEWISRRGDLLALGGANEFECSPDWNAHSLYFTSPDGTILEFIIRRELDNSRSGPFQSSDLLCVSEVGIAVADVTSAVKQLADLGISPYGWNAPDFAPVGDVDGLLILVSPGRSWFPTHQTAEITPISISARAQLSAELTLAPATHLDFTPTR